jgi:hypothetical protein
MHVVGRSAVIEMPDTAQLGRLELLVDLINPGPVSGDG